MLRHMFTSLASAAYFWVTDVRWLDVITFRDCFCVRPLSSREGSRNENRIQIFTRSSVDLLPARHISLFGAGKQTSEELS